MTDQLPRVVLLHGLDGHAEEDWLPWVRDELQASGFDVHSETFPDSVAARRSSWWPHLASLEIDDTTVLVGWSTGAVAAMRWAEQHRILGSVLVGAYSTDLGDPAEKASEWFDAPWNWRAIREHQRFIVQFASTDDDLVPIPEQRYVRDRLAPIYIEHDDRRHYQTPTLPELVPTLRSALAQATAAEPTVGQQQGADSPTLTCRVAASADQASAGSSSPASTR